MIKRGPLDLPPAVARSFMADLKAYFAEESGHKRDAIAARQVHLLNEHRGPHDPKVRLQDVKRLFEMMR